MFKNLLRLWTVALLFATVQGLHAQAGDYSFTVSNNPFSYLGAGAISVPGVLADDVVSTVPIGFTFNFEGAPYTNVVVSSNGFISFNSSAGSVNGNNLAGVSSANRPIVAPLWDDLDGRAASPASAAQYSLSGTAPNRVFTMEWKNWEWNYQANAAVVSFQVKLFEGTDEIEFHYDLLNLPAATGRSASIGLSGASSFLSVSNMGVAPTASKTSENASIDTVVTGQIMKFTPPACIAPTNGGFSLVTSDSVVFGWFSSSTAGTFQIDFGLSGFTQGTITTNITPSSNDTIGVGGLNFGTTYDFYVRTDCGGGVFSGWAGPFTVTTPCPAVPLPVIENFDNGMGCFYSVVGGTTSDTWSNVTDRGGSTLNGTSFMIADSDGAGSGVTMNEYLYSPVVDASSLTGALVLTFDQYYRPLSDNADVEVFDGTNWVTVLSQTTVKGAWGAPTSERIDVTQYANAAFQVRFHYYNATYAWYWSIDNFRMEEVLCNESSNLASYATSSSDISINWVPGDGLSYYVEYGISGFSLGSGTSVLSPDTFEVVGGLSPNTLYDFYVIDTCNGGFSNAIGPLTVSTQCLPIAVPFTETFNSTSSTKGCWTVLNLNNDADSWNLNNTTNVLNGDQNATINTDFNGGANDDWMISPPLNFTGNEQLAYYYRVRSTFEPNDFEVLLSTTGTAPADFTDTLVPFASYSNITYVRQTVDLSTVSGAAYIAWHVPPGGLDGWQIYIDSVVVEPLPACPPPSILTASAITANSATLGWTNPNGTAWNIEFGPAGFIQGSGTGTIVSTTTNPHVLNNLTQVTCYDYYVQQDCGGSGTSTWVGPFNFCTPPTCPAPTNLGVAPSSITTNSADLFWTTGGSTNWNVEYGPQGFTLGSGNHIHATNDTLSVSGLSAGTAYEFYVRDSCSTIDTSTWAGPILFTTAFTTNYLNDFNQTNPFAWGKATGRLRANTAFTSTTSSIWGTDLFGNTGSSSQRINLYAANQFGWLISPSIYLNPAISNLQVEFDVSISLYNSSTQGYLANTDDTLALLISTDNGATWSSSNILWYVDANDTIDVAGEHIIVPVSSYSGYVRFALYGGSVIDNAPDNDLYVDNFEVRTPRACNTPVLDSVIAITTNSADLHWTNGAATASSWDVILTTSGQSPSAGVVSTVTTSGSFSFSNLLPATNYCAYLVETCANGISDTAGPLCFSTACASFTAPFFEDFEGGSASCWSNSNVLGTKQWTINTGSSGGLVNTAYSGTLNARFTSSSGGPYISRFISPTIDVSALSSVQLSFFYAQEVWFGDQNYLTVYYRNSPTAPWTSIWSDSNNVASWTGDTVLIPSTSSTLQIAFEGVDLYGRANVVDDILITEPSACPPPSGLDTLSVSCNQAVATWNSPTTTISSIVEYGAAGFSLGTGTTIANATAPLVIPGLTASTDYEFYVKDVCAAPDSSSWSGPYAFKTDTVPTVVAAFTATQTATTLTNATFSFDASATVGASSYTWTFGNGLSGIGMNTTTSYSMNQSYTVKLVATGLCGAVDSVTQTVTVNGISLEENLYNAELSIYPNPSNGVFTINVGNTTEPFDVEITDLSGRSIFRASNWEPSLDHKVEIQTEASGMYILKITGKGLRMNQRIMLNK